MNDNRFPLFQVLLHWLGFAIPVCRVLGFAIPLLLLTSCDPGRHERMQQELLHARKMNKEYVDFTSSWGNDYLGYSSMRVCTTHPVLKRVEFSRLQELVDMPLSGVVGCLDVDDERIVVSDEEVRNKLLQKSGSDSVTAFQSLNKELQKKIIAEVMECLRIGPRQMSRVSGLSYSVIQRLPGSWGQEH